MPAEQAAAGDEGVTRRGLLALIIMGWAGLMLHLLLAALASVRYLVPNVLYEPLRTFRLKKPEDYPNNTFTYIEEYKVYIAKKDGGIRAVSGVCTHLGCTVNWSEASSQFLCPCHGSRFNADGKNIAGPAPSSLQWYQVSLGRDGRIIVDMDTIVGPKAALKA